MQQETSLIGESNGVVTNRPSSPTWQSGTDDPFSESSDELKLLPARTLHILVRLPRPPRFRTSRDNGDWLNPSR